MQLQPQGPCNRGMQVSKANIFSGLDFFCKGGKWEALGGKIRDEVDLRKSLEVHGVSLF